MKLELPDSVGKNKIRPVSVDVGGRTNEGNRVHPAHQHATAPRVEPRTVQVTINDGLVLACLEPSVRNRAGFKHSKLAS
jgi:hypothetical protein